MQSSTDTTLVSLAVRERLVEALNLDLIGPSANHELAAERLPGWVRPSNWYLTGFLIPSGTKLSHSADVDEEDDMEEVSESGGLAEESTEERRAAKKGFFPSSMGLSFLVAADTDSLAVTVRWGDYERGQAEGADGATVKVWQRRRQERTFTVSLTRSRDYPVPDSSGIRLYLAVKPIDSGKLPDLPKGTQSVSLFLVNHRQPDDADPDVRFAFQAEIEVSNERCFVPRPDPRGAWASDTDDRIADLHYASTPEYATGHGVSADWEVGEDGCRALRTTWIPSAHVEKTETVNVHGAELSMEALGAIAAGDAVGSALKPMVDEYRDWIESQRTSVGSLPSGRREIAGELLHLAGVAADRMERGISILAGDADALDAFRVANRAVARALRQRLPEQFVEKAPAWRSFQLAFILLNLPGIADRDDPEREFVDLLFFPTGGGKTEAYLGLAAFAMVLRRLRSPGQGGLMGAGVTVIMRYTLRLLTLDQLARASGLVCALELEREGNPERYGTWPFEIGLWVGKAATPNLMGRKGEKRSDTARAKTRQFKANPDSRPAPIPLENCPWCGTRFEPASFTLLPNDERPTELRVVCADFECEFSGDRVLPILAVDEPIYRRLPAFLIATVDKFASLPWTAETGTLLGGADRYAPAGFYGAANPGHGQRLEHALLPPDLVIQDELHLISGPLGTMVGLYEATIEALCVRGNSGQRNDAIDEGAVRPKIVASTATVRRAQDQIQALFARPMTQVFPPPGPDRRDSFFARIVSADKMPARQYLGVVAPGRNPKVLMRKTVLALMGAAEKAYRDAGGHGNHANPADPYMTLLGYFNSLRELGGGRRVLEEQVRTTISSYGERRRIGEKRGLFRDRKTFSEVVELTSRVSTNKVAEARQRLEAMFHEKHRIDCAIATNMISVGLDIARLGLMVVVGQPKAHAEYIQATSRVGRDDKRPGLVVTLLNVHKPRDRSHYERFRHYHETFYRSVEVPSATPFSARALDRGFAGALVGLARHSEARLTPAVGAERIAGTRAAIERQLLDCFRGRIEQQPMTDDEERDERLRSVQNRVVDLLDSWLTIVEDYHSINTRVRYQKYEQVSGKSGKPLLREMLDRDFETPHHRKFRANRSLRDVEPEVNLYLKDLRGRDVAD